MKHTSGMTDEEALTWLRRDERMSLPERGAIHESWDWAHRVAEARAALTRALTAQAFGQAVAFWWWGGVDGETYDEDLLRLRWPHEEDSAYLAAARDLASLPAPADLAAEILGEDR